MITVADLWRYPIKAVGREPLSTIALDAGTTLPGDRRWAVAHAAAKLTGGWDHCTNFARAAKAPMLQAVTIESDGDSYTLRHPDLPDLQIALPSDAQALVHWLAPIYPTNRPALTDVVAAPDRGMTDSAFASVSVMNHASLRAMAQKSGRTLEPERFRGNIWVEGAAPWEEFDWLGKTIRIGSAHLKMVEPITRCAATRANPVTGRDDTDTLAILQDDWGHQIFGINAEVVAAGTLSIGDPVHL